MADQNITALPVATAPASSDQLLLVGATEEKLIDYDKLADAILQKLTSKTFTLDQGVMTLLKALNELNSKAFLVKTTNNEDADNITTPGWYRCSNISNASSKFGYLLVFSLYEDDRYVFQIFQDANSSSLSRRVRVSSEWRNWVSM